MKTVNPTNKWRLLDVELQWNLGRATQIRNSKLK